MKLREWSIRRWVLVCLALVILVLVGMRVHTKWRLHEAVAAL
jgi:hypothetical protein